ncbi:glucose-6-phosphate dehydrogenase [Acetobacter sp. AN02]|uniref:glucose-6-phosphate dehydrogenase n=1 Tax=Acetobacter sp. AN02 TaxID=2894186 RepID=UPI0024345275|nr:glucose-6-phosphate dehydrogenase [Acetobacter sp. AN02]MDG6094148.1 glucose-6-phosphate dehydrogenase [Acetobacter sp. AN02]
MPAIPMKDPFDYIIVGATGDLTMRKLLPAFYQRFRAGQIPQGTCIIGVARTTSTTEEYRNRAKEALVEFLPAESQDDKAISDFLKFLEYIPLDAADQEDAHWPELCGLLKNEDRVRVFYLATAPSVYTGAAAGFAEHDLITPKSRIVLEKPIGTDLKSAEAINEGVGQYFPETAIFRIDHYLGKETVQNILALRFANPMIERSWNSSTISHVQITAAETVGVGSRGSYYDTSGALRDMVQNHLLQVLAVVAMEPPVTFSASDLRNEKLKMLRALRPMTEEDVVRDTVRAQYVAGKIGDKSVPGYLEDLGSDTSSTETFLTLRTEIRTPRWAGVPFYLRTGKRLPRKTSEIVIQFRPQPWPIFSEAPPAGRLVIRVQPDEGMSFVFSAKNPDKADFSLREASLDVSFSSEFHTRYPDSYEHLLLDTVRGDQVMFIRRDEVVASWNWIEPILSAWEGDKRPMETYAAGTWGPESSAQLLARDGFVWNEEQPEI